MSEPVTITPETAKKLAHEIVKPTTSGDPVIEAAVQALRNSEAERSLRLLAGYVIPYTEEDTKRVLIENLGVKDPNSGEKTEPTSGPEQARYNKAKEVAKAVREYLETNQIPPDLTNQILDYLSRQPNFGEILQGMRSDDDKKNFVNALLQQPQIRERMRELYIETLNPLKRPENEAIVERLQKEIEAIKQQIIDLDQINDQIANLEDEIRKAQRDIETDTEYAEYEKINQQIQRLQIGLEQYEEQRRNDPNISLGIFVEPRFNSVTDVLNEISQLRSALANSKFNNIRNLQDQIEKKRTQIQLLQEKKSQYNPEEQNRLRQQLAQKEAELKEAEAKLLAERIRYAEDIRSMPERAVKEYLDSALAQAAESYKEKAKKAAQAKAETEKALLDSAIEKITRKLGRKAKKVNGETVYLPDKNKVRRLVMKLASGDLEGFLSVRETSGNLSSIFDMDAIELGLTDEEKALLLQKLQDPAYKKEFAKTMATRVLADYIRAGGKLSREIVEPLINSEWGQYILEQAKNLSEEQKRLIEQYVEPKFMEKLKNIGKLPVEFAKSHWKTIAFIVLLLILLGIGGPFIASKVEF